MSKTTLYDANIIIKSKNTNYLGRFFFLYIPNKMHEILRKHTLFISLMTDFVY